MSTPGNTAKLKQHTDSSAQSSPSLIGREPTIH